MKRLILVAAAIALTVPAMASAQVRVQGYYRSDGTYVQPHYRSSPNSTTLDNYSTRGNVNPYTGQVGSRDPYGSSYRSPYGSSYSNPYSSPYTSSRPSSSSSQPRSNTTCYYFCPN